MDSNLRISTYEMLFPLPHTPGFSLAVNGLYGAYDIITGQEEDCLRAAQASPASLCALPQDTLERLMRRGHLLTSEPAQEERTSAFFRAFIDCSPTKAWSTWSSCPLITATFAVRTVLSENALEKGDEWLSRSMQPEMVSAIFAQMRAYQAQGANCTASSSMAESPFCALTGSLSPKSPRKRQI